MAKGDITDPVIIETGFWTSLRHHFWAVVFNPAVKASLYPDLTSFLEEVSPAIVESTPPGLYFEFSTDPNSCTFQLTYDKQTESYFIQRAYPTSGNAPRVRLPYHDTAVGNLKSKFREKVEELNPFTLIEKFGQSLEETKEE